MRTARLALFLVAGLAPAFAAAEPGPTGPDILVGPGRYAQCPAVAMSAGGDFEVVWSHFGSASHSYPQGVFARHFDRQGRSTQASEIRLDSPATEEAPTVRVAALPDGGYFVAWVESRIRAGLLRTATVGRFLSSAGRPRSPEVRLSRTGHLAALTVVDDSLLLVWEESDPALSLRARRFDFNGKAIGDSFLLTHQPRFGDVGLAPLADSFVATWQAWTGSDFVIVAQRFSLAGEPLSPVLVVNRLNRLQGAYGPRVASDGNDRFAVAWTMNLVTIDEDGVAHTLDNETRARFFDSGGATGPEIRPNQLAAGNQYAAGLAMNRSGVTLVTWSSDRHNATTRSPLDVAGRFLDPAGQLASKAFPIVQGPYGTDFCSAAATSGGDEWAVAWLKLYQGVYARRLTF